MKRFIFFLLVFLLGTSYFFTKFGFSQEPFKFSTQQTRELWQVCAVSFRNINPSIGQDVYFPVCDCYVDHIRANYAPKMMDNMTPEGSNKLSLELRKVCNPKNLRDEDFT
jgi:hypothetical protein